LAEGFDSYQTKPISVKEFLKTVRDVLDLHQGTGEAS
jgi:DNA-binding response OmpR family regulator